MEHPSQPNTTCTPIKTIELIGGPTLTLRTPTEEEAITISDKRLDLMTPGVIVRDYLDDGDEEILDCILSPEKKEIDEWVEDYPLLTTKLLEVLRDLGGDHVPVEKEETVSQTHGKKTIGVKVDNVLLGLQKISRYEFKVLQRELGEKKRVTMRSLASLVKTHVLPDYKEAAERLFQKYAYLSMNLGAFLFNAASVQVHDFFGVSTTASKKGPPLSSKPESSSVPSTTANLGAAS